MTPANSDKDLNKNKGDSQVERQGTPGDSGGLDSRHSTAPAHVGADSESDLQGRQSAVDNSARILESGDLAAANGKQGSQRAQGDVAGQPQAQASMANTPQAPSPVSGSEASAGVNNLRPADVDFMPGLLRSFSILMRLRGKTVSPQQLLAALSGSKLTPRTCLAAARKAGLSGRIMSRPQLTEISPLVLPCILLLKNDRSCVLISMRDNRAEVIFPELAESAETVTLHALQENYSGYAIFASVPKAPEKRITSPTLGRSKAWFWDVLKYYAPIYRHVALASIVINLIAIATPLFVMNVYDRVVPNNATDTLWVLASGIFLIYLFNFLLTALRSHFVDVAGRNADVVLSSLLVEKVLSMRLDAKPQSTGAMVNNLREFEQLREFFSSSSLLALIDLPFLVIFLLLIAFIAGPMVFLPVGAIPVLICVGIYLQYRSKKSAEDGFKLNMQKNALLVELVNGLETLKSCIAEHRMQKLWEAVSGQSAEASSHARKYTQLAVACSVFVTQLVTVAMIVWGVYRIADGLMSMGALIACNILVGRTMAPLLQVATLLTRVQNSRMALKGLDMIMQLPAERINDDSSMDYGTLEPYFEMENVSFAYPGSQLPALMDINLKIKPGEKIGIIGAMGSGKSSLARLLLGLYQPAEGSVRFGGVDIRQIPTANLRGRIGVLPQDVVLFYGSVRENIALGDPSINDHLILRASALAGVTDFVRNHPEGFGAQVGEQGKALSGGQRQAVALARALVRDPEVIILDEPTSNMDTTSEFLLQRRLEKIIGNNTLILITHRLSMLRMVNRLIVMDKGRIINDGPRDEVLARLKSKSRGTGRDNSGEYAVESA